MAILVDKKPIEVRLRYVDIPYPGGAVGTQVFRTKKEEEKWVKKENERRKDKVMELKAKSKDIPSKMEKDAQDDVKELVTFWKRTDWGTQQEISEACTTINNLGDVKIDYAKYRSMQMEKLMIGWNIKDQNGDPVKIEPSVISKIDYPVAIALIDKYESLITPSDEETENLD